MMDLLIASNFYSFFWDLVSALFLGIILFGLGVLLGWYLWKDRLETIRQAPRANESLRKDIERLEAQVDAI